MTMVNDSSEFFGAFISWLIVKFDFVTINCWVKFELFFCYVLVIDDLIGILYANFSIKIFF